MHERLYPVLEAFLRGTMNIAEVQGIDRLIELDLSMTQARLLFVLAHDDLPRPSTCSPTGSGSRWPLPAATSTSSCSRVWSSAARMPPTDA